MNAARMLPLFLLGVLPAGPAVAQDAPEAPAASAPCPDTLRGIPPALDPKYRHRKDLQVEAGIFGGTYLGATLGGTFLSGARVAFHVDGMWAVQVEYDYSRWGDAKLDRNVHHLTAAALISNDLAVRFGRTVVPMDLYLTLGVGATRLDAVWEPLGRVGGGVKFYTGVPWLAVRIDLDTWIHPVAGHVDSDISLALGLSFLFPASPAPLEGGPCRP